MCVIRGKVKIVGSKQCVLFMAKLDVFLTVHHELTIY